MAATPEVRFSALTGDRVIIAPGRASRPNLPEQAAREESPPHYDPQCPFCPGNEKATPPEVFRIPGGGGSGEAGWQVRVVTNKYPALVAEAAPLEKPGSFRYAEPAIGRHEVIIDHPRHDRDFGDFDAGEMLNALQACRERFGAAAADERVRHVVIFRNEGPMANASLPHPHSQLAALSFVPSHIRKMLERSLEHRGAGGHALLFDIVREEVESGDRLIDTTRRFATFVPYAPAHDYEIWVAPRFVPPRFDQVDDETLAEFGEALSRALLSLRVGLNGPDYNYVIQTAPLVGAEASMPWYVQIIPRLTLAAGFELGVGVQILVTRPEDAASRLRDAVP
jgi:UDPglucose--hexose-1-phosphate uridylyltransferase